MANSRTARRFGRATRAGQAILLIRFQLICNILPHSGQARSNLHHYSGYAKQAARQALRTILRFIWHSWMQMCIMILSSIQVIGTNTALISLIMEVAYGFETKNQAGTG